MRLVETDICLSSSLPSSSSFYAVGLDSIIRIIANQLAYLPLLSLRG